MTMKCTFRDYADPAPALDLLRGLVLDDFTGTLLAVVRALDFGVKKA